MGPSGPPVQWEGMREREEWKKICLNVDNHYFPLKELIALKKLQLQSIFIIALRNAEIYKVKITQNLTI